MENLLLVAQHARSRSANQPTPERRHSTRRVEIKRKNDMKYGSIDVPTKRSKITKDIAAIQQHLQASRRHAPNNSSKKVKKSGKNKKKSVRTASKRKTSEELKVGTPLARCIMETQDSILKIRSQLSQILKEDSINDFEKINQIENSISLIKYNKLVEKMYEISRMICQVRFVSLKDIHPSPTKDFREFSKDPLNSLDELYSHLRFIEQECVRLSSRNNDTQPVKGNDFFMEEMLSIMQKVSNDSKASASYGEIEKNSVWDWQRSATTLMCRLSSFMDKNAYLLSNEDHHTLLDCVSFLSTIRVPTESEKAEDFSPTRELTDQMSRIYQLAVWNEIYEFQKTQRGKQADKGSSTIPMKNTDTNQVDSDYIEREFIDIREFISEEDVKSNAMNGNTSLVQSRTGRNVLQDSNHRETSAHKGSNRSKRVRKPKRTYSPSRDSLEEDSDPYTSEINNYSSIEPKSEQFGFSNTSESKVLGCLKCKKNDDQTKLLLCDNDCGREYHCGCLTPALKSVPKGPWFCPICLETEKIKPGKEIFKCSASGCSYITGGKYCYRHRCMKAGCSNRRRPKGYCKAHSASNEFE